MGCMKFQTYVFWSCPDHKVSSLILNLYNIRSSFNATHWINICFFWCIKRIKVILSTFVYFQRNLGLSLIIQSFNHFHWKFHEIWVVKRLSCVVVVYSKSELKIYISQVHVVFCWEIIFYRWNVNKRVLTVKPLLEFLNSISTEYN
jgi:hypothetical protein